MAQSYAVEVHVWTDSCPETQDADHVAHYDVVTHSRYAAQRYGETKAGSEYPDWEQLSGHAW